MIFALLVRRNLRSGIVGTLALVVGLLVFELVVPPVAEDVGTNQLDPVLRALPPAVQALTRSSPDLLIGAGIQGYLAVGFTSPVYLLMILAGMLAFSTGLAGELERGSVQLALSRPVSRLTLYGARVAGVFVLALVLGAAGPVGIELGLRISQPSEPVNRMALVPTAVAAMAFLWAVGGIGLMLAAAGQRAGQVVGQTIAWLVVSYFVDYFATLWSMLKPLTPFSVFNYFKPTATLIHGTWPTHDLVVLVLAGLIAIVTGAAIFRLRDLPV